MTFLSTLKLIAETITAISAAIIVLMHLWSKAPKKIKRKIKYILIFIFGTKDLNGKNVYFCNAVKAYKENNERQQNIMKVLSSNNDYKV